MRHRIPSLYHPVRLACHFLSLRVESLGFFCAFFLRFIPNIALATFSGVSSIFTTIFGGRPTGRFVAGGLLRWGAGGFRRFMGDSSLCCQTEHPADLCRWHRGQARPGSLLGDNALIRLSSVLVRLARLFGSAQFRSMCCGASGSSLGLSL